MIFLLSIRFLDDRFHGTTDNGASTEWPPSPFRVFQALVAGNARGDRVPDEVRDALLWLERLDPPDIIAPRVSDGMPLLTYVLNNVSDSEFGSRAPKTVRPTILNGDRLVEYVWTFDRSPEADRHVKVLHRASRRVRALGWGIDLAIGRGETREVMPEISTARSRYTTARIFTVAGADRRVPSGGSLLSLEGNYRQFLGRYETPGVTAFESAGAIYETRRYVTGRARPSIAFRLVDDDGDAVSVRQQLLSPLVGMIRNLANSRHVIDAIGTDIINRDIKGHPKSGTVDRVSILPLPTIRDGPTDGRIRRVLLMQPSESNGVLCRQLADLLDGQPFTPEKSETRFKPMRLERLLRRDSVLKRYTGPSRVWSSATPVLLPGYDDRKQHRGNHLKRLERAKQLLQKALDHVGLDAGIRNVELSRVPFFTGSLHTRDYDIREKLAHYPRYHVFLEFEQPIAGPLAIGAGRHVGFGTLAVCDSQG